MKIKEMKQGEHYSIVLRLKQVDERVTSKGKAYCVLHLTDGSLEIDAKAWDTNKTFFEDKINQILEFYISVGVYNEKLDYTVKRVSNAPEGYDLRNFKASAPFNSEKMHNVIVQTLSSYRMADGTRNIADVAINIYMKNHEKLLCWAAAKKQHHNIYGGLLYHTFRMMMCAKRIAPVYPIINERLLLCAAALHDIGKLTELCTDEFGTADYTVEGNLLGHLFIGAEMVTKSAEEVNCTDEEVLLLKHCILSHHGIPEYGNVKTPAIPEALLLHQLDMIDSRIYQFEKVYEDLEPGTESEKIFGLDTKVYRAKGQKEELPNE